jgi:hypothetical protein
MTVFAASQRARPSDPLRARGTITHATGRYHAQDSGQGQRSAVTLRIIWLGSLHAISSRPDFFRSAPLYASDFLLGFGMGIFLRKHIYSIAKFLLAIVIVFSVSFFTYSFMRDYQHDNPFNLWYNNTSLTISALFCTLGFFATALPSWVLHWIKASIAAVGEKRSADHIMDNK